MGGKKKVRPCQWVPRFSTYLQNDHSATLLKKLKLVWMAFLKYMF